MSRDRMVEGGDAFQRILPAVGEGLYRNDPIVHQGLELIRHGADPEWTLCRLVAILAESNSELRRALLDAAMRAPPGPMSFRVPVEPWPVPSGPAKP